MSYIKLLPYVLAVALATGAYFKGREAGILKGVESVKMPRIPDCKCPPIPPCEKIDFDKIKNRGNLVLQVHQHIQTTGDSLAYNKFLQDIKGIFEESGKRKRR